MNQVNQTLDDRAEKLAREMWGNLCENQREVVELRNKLCPSYKFTGQVKVSFSLPDGTRNAGFGEDENGRT